MGNDEKLVSGILGAWKGNIERAGKLFNRLSPPELEREIAPGKNRLIYLWGHLTAVHDAMLPLLDFGPRFYPDWEQTFIKSPDRAASLPSSEEIRVAWGRVNARLAEEFAKLPPAGWLERHTAVSQADFEKEPWRNRLAILLSRTNHVAYHLGQAALVK